MWLVTPLIVDCSTLRRLVIDYSASRRLVVDYSTSRRLVVDYSASRRLVVDNSASRRLVVDYFASTERPGASARRATRRQLLRLRRASGYLGTSHGSSRSSSCRSSSTTPPRAGSSSTTSPPPHVRAPRHVARLVTRLVAPPVINYFASAARPGASAHRVARHAVRRAARRRLLHLA
jgi:hypothetical protein